MSWSQIASALRGDTSLQSLDIGGNNIGPQGITAVAEALRGNENLATLELGYNPIGEAGAKALASVIKYDLKVHTGACPANLVCGGGGMLCGGAANQVMCDAGWPALFVVRLRYAGARLQMLALVNI